MYNSVPFLFLFFFYLLCACSYTYDFKILIVFVMFPFFIWFLLFFVEKNLPNYSRHSRLNYFDHHHTLFSWSFVGWELKMLEHIFTDSKCWSNSTVIIPLVNTKIMNSLSQFIYDSLFSFNFVDDYLLKWIYQSLYVSFYVFDFVMFFMLNNEKEILYICEWDWCV